MPTHFLDLDEDILRGFVRLQILIEDNAHRVPLLSDPVDPIDPVDTIDTTEASEATELTGD